VLEVASKKNLFNFWAQAYMNQGLLYLNRIEGLQLKLLILKWLRFFKGSVANAINLPKWFIYINVFHDLKKVCVEGGRERNISDPNLMFYMGSLNGFVYLIHNKIQLTLL
jgi:hypothetical protein